jgi:hypothetical protein
MLPTTNVPAKLTQARMDNAIFSCSRMSPRSRIGSHLAVCNCRPRGEARSHDTIAMVAIDQYGNVAAATSTNGATNKIPGRWATQLSLLRTFSKGRFRLPGSRFWQNSGVSLLRFR